MGQSTNNIAEFQALEQGFEMLRHERKVNVIVEGYSTLSIYVTQRLQCGTPMNKVTRNWKLSQIIHRIKDQLEEPKIVEFTLVRHSENALADKVTNEGVKNPKVLTEMTRE